MRHTGIALSALAVALTCGTGAAFAQYGHAPQQEYRQAQDQRQNQYRGRDDHRDANTGYGVYGGYSNYGYATQYVQPVYGYGEGGSIYYETPRVQTYYTRDGDDHRFRQDDRRGERGDDRR